MYGYIVIYIYYNTYYELQIHSIQDNLELENQKLNISTLLCHAILTVHGKPVEGNDPIRRVCDSECLHPQLASDVRLRWCGTTLIEVIQHHRVSGERQ